MTATLIPEATVDDMAALVEAWPSRANRSQLKLVRPASHGPQLSFTAWSQQAITENRWAAFARLNLTWPEARLSINGAATVELMSCDPWAELT
ncbi:MAG: hypothetical protein Q4G46_15305, partial [Propionibacteriaceae bacterium]|nr:hypothetical protein [Propionibacteriaceae bacterium]